MKNNSKQNIFENINTISFMAMIFIVIIHFSNIYSDYGIYTENEYLMSLIRGIALIAVPLYVGVSSYTSLHLNKKVSYEKIFLYIIIPTIFFTQLNHLFFDYASVSFTLSDGFSGSWFGDMYIVSMIFMPLLQYIYQKKQKVSIIVSLIGINIVYGISIYTGSSTLLNFGLYTGLLYLPLYYVLAFFIFENKFYNRILFIITLIICFLLLGFAYSPLYYDVFEIHRTLIISYFSPISIVATICLFKIVINENFSIPNIRMISSSSYFLYFTHYIIIRLYHITIEEITWDYPGIFLVITIILAIISSTILFKMYVLLLKIIKIGV